MKKPVFPYLITITLFILGGFLPVGLFSLYDSKTLSKPSVKEVIPVAFYSSHQCFDTLLLLAKDHTLRPLASTYTSQMTTQVSDTAIKGLSVLQEQGLYFEEPSSLSLRSADAYALSETYLDRESLSNSSTVVWKVIFSGEGNSLTELLLDDATQTILSVSHWSPVAKTETVEEKQAALSAFVKAFSEFCVISYDLIEVSTSLASYPDRAELSFLTPDEESLSFSLTLSGYSFSFSVKEAAD